MKYHHLIVDKLCEKAGQNQYSVIGIIAYRPEKEIQVMFLITLHYNVIDRFGRQ